jgi:hypothetical protein
MFPHRPASPAISSARTATGTSAKRSNENERTSDIAGAITRANPRATSSAVNASDARSTLNGNNATSPEHTLQSVGDGVGEKTATKPSAFIPFDLVANDTRHHVHRVSSTRPAVIGTTMHVRNKDSHASGRIRASAVARAGVGRANPPAASSEVDAVQGPSLHNSESQTTRGAQSTMDRNNRAAADYALQRPADGVWEKPENQSSGETSSDTVATATRHYVPRPPPGVGASNIYRVPRPPPQGGQSANQSGSKHRKSAMNSVPRPPRSSTGGRFQSRFLSRP